MLLDRGPIPGMQWIKIILVMFNFLFVITGVCLILVGWSINYVYFEYSEFVSAHFFSPGILMMAIGVIVFAVALFGCWGAYKESTCMIMVFSVMLAVIFVLEVAAGVSAFLLQSNIHSMLERTITEAIADSPIHNSSAHMMDVLQTELECCGVHSSKDWDGVYGNNGSIILPESCCMRYDGGDGELTANCTQVYNVGCLPQLQSFISESIFLLAGTASTIALIQLIGVTFSCSLAKMIRMQKTERDRLRWEMREQLINSYAQGEGSLMNQPEPVWYDNFVMDIK